MRAKSAVVMALAVSMIAILAVPAYAGGGKEDLVNRLLRSYDNLKTFLQNMKGEVNETAVQRIDEAISRADPLVEEARKDLSSGNVDDALEKLKEALSIMRDVLKDLKEVEVIKEATRLRIALGRMYGILERARFAINSLKRKGADTSSLEGRLEEIKSLLDEAKSLLISGDLNLTKNRLEEARSLMKEVYQGIKDMSREYLNLAREKVFKRIKIIEEAAERCVVKLDIVGERLRQANKTDSANKVIELKEKIEGALVSLRTHLKNGQKDLVIEDIRELMRYLKICRRIGR